MPILRLCRFDAERRLHYEDVDILKTSYIAVSHVWTNSTSMTSIPGIPSKVKTSPQKARFIVNRLPGLVGNKPFWMDILAVDQDDKAAVSAIVNHIPAIYGNADKTIIIREDGGFKECCGNVLGRTGAEDSTELGMISKKHLAEHHRGEFNEEWLTRVWPYQELRMSTTVHFVVCQREDRDFKHRRHMYNGVENRQFVEPKVLHQFMEQMAEVKYLAQEWLMADQREQHLILKSGEINLATLNEVRNEKIGAFLQAMFCGGNLSRSLLNRPSGPLLRQHGGELMLSPPHNMFSPRIASRSHDLVLSLFPSCGWYTAPAGARSMTVGEVWEDAILQWGAEKRPKDTFIPRITCGMLDATFALHKAASPTSKIPIPTTLGDLCRLFIAPSRISGQHFQNLDVKSLGVPWTMEKVDSSATMPEVLEIVMESLHFSQTRIAQMENRFLLDGLLSVGRDEPTTSRNSGHTVNGAARSLAEQQEKRIALEIILTISDLLNNVLGHLDTDSSRSRPYIYKRWWNAIIDSSKAWDSPRLRSLVLQITALYTCYFPFSCLEWSLLHLQPFVLRPLIGHGIQSGMPRILTLAAKNLILTPQDEVSISDGPIDRYLCIKSPRNGMLPRVVGMLPMEVRFDSEIKYMVIFDRGCPSVFPIENGDMKPIEYLVWCRIYAELRRRMRSPFAPNSRAVVDSIPDTSVTAGGLLTHVVERNLRWSDRGSGELCFLSINRQSFLPSHELILKRRADPSWPRKLTEKIAAFLELADKRRVKALQTQLQT